MVKYYLTSQYPCSYLDDRQARSEIAVATPEEFGQLIRAGFRRSGAFVYRPYCRDCSDCIAVRVDTAHFHPNRSQRRCLKRFRSLQVASRGLEFEPEHYDLYMRYQRTRHPGGSMEAEEQYREALLASHVLTHLYEFREDDRLVMISIVDEIEDGLSSVYTFYDPGRQDAGLGTYGILWQIDLCRKLGYPHLYLGYWIERSKKMAYKINFQPLEGYIDGKWSTLSK